ncbi:hypothetical protein VTJ04DRAFT_6363 [Mycothermus thermophilus]|uniref:uncharacterized protein n=1 Tax=Humicola insolens TaxID=85995 RepID=UPI003743FBBF
MSESVATGSRRQLRNLESPNSNKPKRFGRLELPFAAIALPISSGDSRALLLLSYCSLLWRFMSLVSSVCPFQLPIFARHSSAGMSPAYSFS